VRSGIGVAAQAELFAGLQSQRTQRLSAGGRLPPDPRADVGDRCSLDDGARQETVAELQPQLLEIVRVRRVHLDRTLLPVLLDVPGKQERIMHGVRRTDSLAGQAVGCRGSWVEGRGERSGVDG
jgi:hypothetical protein